MLAWSRQLDSELARDHRLVAMDLRGHGLSEKPRDAYGDSRLWADDVRAVIDALNLDRPVLCGWSYARWSSWTISGITARTGLPASTLSAGITKLGSDAAMSVITPEWLSLVPGFLATDVEESMKSRVLVATVLRSAAVGKRSALMLGVQRLSAASCPAGPVLSGLRQRRSPPRIRKPVLITQGAKDAIVKPEVVDQHKAGLAHAQIDIMPDAGHAPFWEDSSAFNQRLRAFVEMCSAAAMARPAIAYTF